MEEFLSINELTFAVKSAIEVLSINQVGPVCQGDKPLIHRDLSHAISKLSNHLWVQSRITGSKLIKLANVEFIPLPMLTLL